MNEPKPIEEVTPTEQAVNVISETVGRINNRLAIGENEVAREQKAPIQSKVDSLIESLHYINEKLQRIESVVEKI
jgi:hypothetical protein